MIVPFLVFLEESQALAPDHAIISLPFMKDHFFLSVLSKSILFCDLR